MAEATTQAECIARHEAYPYDISRRLRPPQRARMAGMAAFVRPGETVLDVGCNSGYLTEFLPPGCICDGVDVAGALIGAARARLRQAYIAPAEDLPYGAGSVDVVVLGEILEHVHDPLVVLGEAWRVARRAVVGSTPHEASAWGPSGRKPPATHRFHVRCYTEATLRATLAEAIGWPHVEVTTIEDGGFPQFYLFAIRTDD